MKSFLFAFLIGAVSAAGFAPLSFPPALLFGYAWLFWRLARDTHMAPAFWRGWAFGFGQFLFGLYWIGESTLIDFASWGWFWPLATFGPPLLLAFYPAIAAALSVKTRVPAMLFFALAELARATFFTGFPWNLSGSTWIDLPWIAQNADWAGLYGLSCITLLMANLIAQYRSHRAMVLLAVLVTVLAGYGALTRMPSPIFTPDKSTDTPVAVHIMQPNIPQKIKWEPDLVFSNSLAPLAMSDEPSFEEAGEHIIIWPETAQASPVWRDPEFQKLYRGALADWPDNTTVITGYLALDPGTDMANAVIAADTQGRTLWRADKHHLVPFGEYMPFDEILKIGPIVGIEGFASGTPPQNMAGGIIPLICYEIIFPQYARKAAGSSSRAIVTITDDSWFGQYSGPRQHLVQARFRAIENGLPVLRAANTGISAIVDSYGRVLDFRDMNITSRTDAYMPLRRPGETFYTVFGNLFVLLFLGLGFVIRLLDNRFFSGN